MNEHPVPNLHFCLTNLILHCKTTKLVSRTRLFLRFQNPLPQRLHVLHIAQSLNILRQ
eukprot:FN601495.1.p1 GENE.FN601495.1~~FN601495.1.p1  ORF type:complete len:58 (-),score=2.57 FN601495.1:11-184(-)